MNNFTMYGLLVRASVKSRMQYKFNFWFSTIIAALISTLEFAMLAVILHKFGQLKGWSLAEASYLYAVLTLSKALYRTFASDVHHIEKYLISGDLDSFLVRPVSVLINLMTQNYFVRIGEFIQGIVILTLCMKPLLETGQLTAAAIPLTIVVIVTGSLILFAIGLITAAAGFWLTVIEQLQNITEDASRTAAQYPLSIYPGWLKSFLIGVIPIGFANYLPSLYILKQEMAWWIIPISALIGCLLLGAALFIWRLGLQRYQSTGS